MAKPALIEIAHRHALRGEIETATDEFTALRNNGDIGACAALAEINAYKGNWPEVVKCVQSVFGSPAALRTMNVYTDMAMLAARASSELKAWTDLARLAKFAATKLTKKPADSANAATVRRLLKAAESKALSALTEATAPAAKNKANFDAAIEKAKLKKFTTSTGRLDHLYGLARVFTYHEGAVQLFDSEKKLPNLFDNAVFTASALARVGREKEAWSAIKEALPRWWPVELTQVAPVILLTDEALGLVMIASRCKEVLSIPRGPEAAKK
jgi:hypothetical protein